MAVKSKRYRGPVTVFLNEKSREAETSGPFTEEERGYELADSGRHLSAGYDGRYNNGKSQYDYPCKCSGSA